MFKEISMALDSEGREGALFNCLKVPDDSVKLAVVGCLFVVSINELEQNEIEKITNIMSTCNNISAGETELVLSTVYWICTKFVKEPEEGEEPSKGQQVFQKEKGE